MEVLPFKKDSWLSNKTNFIDMSVTDMDQYSRKQSSNNSYAHKYNIIDEKQTFSTFKKCFELSKVNNQTQYS